MNIQDKQELAEWLEKIEFYTKANCHDQVLEAVENTREYFELVS